MTIKPKRHIAKTISYRVISSAFGFVVLWISTGDIRIGASFSLMELCYKPIVYYLHERCWYKFIKYGIKRD